MRYKVTWGEKSLLIVAESKDAAWREFLSRTPEAYKNPSLHERKIEEHPKQTKRSSNV